MMKMITTHTLRKWIIVWRILQLTQYDSTRSPYGHAISLTTTHLRPRSQQPLSGSLSTGILWHQLHIGPLGLGHRLVLLHHNDFNVTRRSHVSVNPSVGTIRATTQFWRLVDLNVLHD